MAMADGGERPRAAIPAERVAGILEMAARAPSILNTQPWQFAVTPSSIELHADSGRRLRADTAGREMLISCGAALFGLRIAVRSLGYQPDVQLLPHPERPRVLARVRLGVPAPLTARERALIATLPRRHTHRGAFASLPLPAGLLIGLQHDAVAEHASLALIDRSSGYEWLAATVARVMRTKNAETMARADSARWVRAAGSMSRDGVPVTAIPQPHGRIAGRLADRDLDLGHGLGRLPSGGAPAAATAVLVSRSDSVADWIRTGQALHRLLLHAAGVWVFASLHSQPLDDRAIRALVRSKLRLPGPPQVLLEFGVSRAAPATARRPPSDFVVAAAEP
jgi:nitroreductase